MDLQSPPGHSPALWPAYVCESLSSIGTTLLMVGIFFYTEHYLRWGLRQNYLLAAAQGAAYVLGALAADRLSRTIGSRRRLLIALYGLLIALPLLAGFAAAGIGLVTALLLYTFVSAMNWPLLESLVASGADAQVMSRRIGLYNLVWSGTNVAAFAASGALIELGPMGLFITPAISHGLAAALMLLSRRIDPADHDSHGAIAPAPGHPAPEPALVAQRTLALWLARIALPATYIVVYSLSAMMPLLPVLHPYSTSTRTLIGSAWMGARWIIFLVLGATVWWHTRPRILLLAAGVMLVAFLAVTLRPSTISNSATPQEAIDLAWMLGAQVLLGLSMGIIYAGSLYFGMVLSEGSTEHGGYHEALIGLGSILGPGIAAMAQWQWPGSLGAGVTAVGALLAMTLAGACVVSGVLSPGFAKLEADKEAP